MLRIVGARSRRLFDAWIAAGEAAPIGLKRAWPGETAVITEMIRPGRYRAAATPSRGRYSPAAANVSFAGTLCYSSLLWRSPAGAGAADSVHYFCSFANSMAAKEGPCGRRMCQMRWELLVCLK